jgi:SAM-dependent methyltransferase
VKSNAVNRRLIWPLKRFADRLLRRVRGQDAAYWQRRRHMQYYREVIRLARAHAPNAKTVLDVGARDTPVVIELDWIPSRTAIDFEVAPDVPGVVGIKGDFLEFRPAQPFDLVICLQVLEHLDDPHRFAQKLFDTGRVVIISVPYQWPAGFCLEHPQDPIDEQKLMRWTEQQPVDKAIVTDDRLARFIGVFAGRQ